MKIITKNTLDSLGNIDWFHATGVQDLSNATVLDSWDKALESCSSIEWQNLLIEAANNIRIKVLKASLPRFKEWNLIVRELKESTIPFVNVKIQHVVEKHNLSKQFSDVVQWDILHLAIEAEFSDIVPPSFYASQSFYYSKGHFPCGWKGKFPKGQLIVY